MWRVSRVAAGMEAVRSMTVKQWQFWLHIAKFLPRRLIWASILWAGILVCRHLKIKPDEAKTLTIEQFGTALFDSWGW